MADPTAAPNQQKQMLDLLLAQGRNSPAAQPARTPAPSNSVAPAAAIVLPPTAANTEHLKSAKEFLSLLSSSNAGLGSGAPTEFEQGLIRSGNRFLSLAETREKLIEARPDATAAEKKERTLLETAIKLTRNLQAGAAVRSAPELDPIRKQVLDNIDRAPISEEQKKTAKERALAALEQRYPGAVQQMKEQQQQFQKNRQGLIDTLKMITAEPLPPAK